MLSVLAGRRDLAEIGDPGPLRIAVSIRHPLAGAPVERTWAAAARDSAAALREAGHVVRAADPPYGQRAGASAIARWTAGTELDARLLADRGLLERRIRRHAAAGRLVLRLGLPKPTGRERWRRRAEGFFAGHDVLVTPALAQSPIRAVAWSARGWLANVQANARYAPFAAPWNLAGWPAMTVPAGLGGDGVPRAVQLVAPPGGEALLLAVAAQLERLRPWPRTAPGSA